MGSPLPSSRRFTTDAAEAASASARPDGRPIRPLPSTSPRQRSFSSSSFSSVASASSAESGSTRVAPGPSPLSRRSSSAGAALLPHSSGNASRASGSLLPADESTSSKSASGSRTPTPSRPASTSRLHSPSNSFAPPFHREQQPTARESISPHFLADRARSTSRVRVEGRRPWHPYPSGSSATPPESPSRARVPSSALNFGRVAGEGSTKAAEERGRSRSNRGQALQLGEPVDAGVGTGKEQSPSGLAGHAVVEEKELRSDTDLELASKMQRMETFETEEDEAAQERAHFKSILKAFDAYLPFSVSLRLHSCPPPAAD
jgi:hypothetical protein